MNILRIRFCFHESEVYLSSPDCSGIVTNCSGIIYMFISETDKEKSRGK